MTKAVEEQTVEVAGEIEQWPISKVKPYKRNAKNHPPEQVQALARLMKKVGFDVPIVVDAKGVVLKGHGRLVAAKALGMKTVPVIVRDLDDARATEARIGDNRLSEFGWDQEALIADVIEGLKHGLEVEVTGFTLQELGLDFDASGNVTSTNEPAIEDQPIVAPVEEDEAPPLPKKAKSKVGQIWQLGAHRLACADSTDPKTWAVLLGKEKARLMATDPPYGVSYTKTKEGMIAEDWAEIANDDLTGDGLKDFLVRVYEAVKPFLESAAWYIWHAAGPNSVAFIQAMQQCDVLLHRQIIWAKPQLILGRSGMYHWKHEPCFYGWVQGSQPPWYGPKNQTSIWEIAHEARSARVHPTQKPLELFAIPMRNHLQPGEVCIEPFAGSGSQLIAAEQLGVSCRAAEMSPQYVDVIIERWQNLTGGKAKLVR